MIIKPYLSPSGELPAYFLDPAIEQALDGAMEHGDHASHLNLPPLRIREIIDKATRKIGSPVSPAAILSSSPTRFFLRQMLEAALPNVQVLSHGEIPPGIKVVSLGLIQ
jgi:flagellar biosynthesis protein FlhA